MDSLTRLFMNQTLLYCVSCTAAGFFTTEPIGEAIVDIDIDRYRYR